MKKKLDQSYENLLEPLYQSPSFLPPIWRVIYQEAMRGNDMLFGNLSLDEKPSLLRDYRSIIEASEQILEASELETMKKTIHGLSPKERSTLKKVYKGTLESWRRQHLDSLN